MPFGPHFENPKTKPKIAPVLFPDLFPDDEVGVPTAPENSQNNSSHTLQRPQFSFRERGPFSQDDLFLPAKTLITEEAGVMDQLVGRVHEDSTQMPYARGTLKSLSASLSPGARASFSISPSRAGGAARNRKNWLPIGRERRRGAG